MPGSATLTLALAVALTPAQQLSLARHLASTAPYQSITEYERLLYQHPNSQEAQRAQDEMGDLYDRMGLGAHARYRWELALSKRNIPDLRLKIAESYLRDGDTLNARLIFEDFDGTPGKTGTLRCLMQEYRWGEAYQLAEGLAEESIQWRPLLDKLSSAKNQPYLDPVEMGKLSTWLPGLGQWRSSQRENAVGSFLLNGLFLGLAGYRASQRDPWGALAIVLFGSRFYVGGIQNAREFAADANEKQDKRVLEECLRTFSKASSPATP